jgi:hypothetical protein
MEAYSHYRRGQRFVAACCRMKPRITGQRCQLKVYMQREYNERMVDYSPSTSAGTRQICGVGAVGISGELCAPAKEVEREQEHEADRRANSSTTNWRKRVGVEPTGDIARCHPPVLKTGTITGPHALPLVAG